MAKLIVLSGELTGRPFDLIEDRITLGRASDNTMRIEDKTISSHHAVLTIDGQDYIVKDLNSTNGTRVNGRRITEVKLSQGDHLRIGSVELKYESEKKKSGQPLPPTSRGVDLTATTTQAAVTPVSLSSASPFPRRDNKMNWVLNSIIGLLVVVALVALALMFLKISKSH